MARSHTALALAWGWGCRQGFFLRALLVLADTAQHSWQIKVCLKHVVE